jgi:YfiH family protein
LHVGDDPVAVIERRERLLEKLGLSLDNLVVMEQVHGANINIVSKSEKGRGAREMATAIPATDALITREPGIILIVSVADCFPVFIHDPATPAIGLAHAGWRGALAGIAGKTLQAMKAEFGSRVEDCRVLIGPGIGPCCFRVGSELEEEFAAHFPEAVSRRSDDTYIDLPQVIIQPLIKSGVALQQIFGSSECTSCLSERYFSHRAEDGRCGRMMGILTLSEV